MNQLRQDFPDGPFNRYLGECTRLKYIDATIEITLIISRYKKAIIYILYTAIN